MTEIFLDGFIIISVLERDNGKGVTEVMDTAGIKVVLRGNLVVMEICLFGVDGCSVRIGEDKLGGFAGRETEVCPCWSGSLTFGVLFCFSVRKDFDDIGRGSDEANTVLLHRGNGIAAVSLRSFLELLVYSEDMGLEINIAPRQAKGFRFSKSGEDDDFVQIGKVFMIKGRQEFFDLICGQR